MRPMTLDSRDCYRPVAQIFTRGAPDLATIPDPLGYEREFDAPAPLGAAYKDGKIRPTSREPGLVRAIISSP